MTASSPEAPWREAWRFELVDSLEKVFADEAPRPLDRAVALTAFAGQVVSFQVAMLPPSVRSFDELGDVVVEMDPISAVRATAATVDLVPCTLVAFDGHDDGWLRDTAGLYPDLLRPLPPDGRVVPFVGQWRAVWFAVTAPEGVDGPVEVSVRVRSVLSGEVLFAEVVTIEVCSAPLPPLDIVNTHWIHVDCLADRYGDDVFDEAHWRAIEATIASAAAMGANSVLTPTWTPPLDTAVGGTRRRVQLVGIADVAGEYRFDFSRLRRWIDTCRRSGMRYLEVAHLFTQWGAAATPQIAVDTDTGVEVRFGWHVPATDPAYRRLLVSLIPALRAELDERWGLERVFFHVSDEPDAETLDSYRAAVEVVSDLLEGCTVIDALSDFAFFSRGLVPHPVVATDAVQPFLDAGVIRPWMYYCVAQDRDVSNRFIGLPSIRNRVLGPQLFLAGAGGFLHWGFDFYNTAGSVASIDPFRDTCAGGAFLAGDPFVVYPGEDRVPWESIRYRVLAETMDDHRMMQLLRDVAGDLAVRAIVDPDSTASMRRFDTDPQRYRSMIAALFEAIVDRLRHPLPGAPRPQGPDGAPPA